MKQSLLFLFGIRGKNCFRLTSLQIPLIVSGVLYASNSVYTIDYVDCLFIAFSAATTTGLATVDLSRLNGFQQAVLLIMFNLGSMVSLTLAYPMDVIVSIPFNSLCRWS